MRRPSLLIFSALLALGVGCDDDSGNGDGNGGSIDASYEGIYKLTAYTKNDTSCDAPGPSVLETQDARFVVLILSSLGGLQLLQGFGCTDVASCHDVAAKFKAQQAFALSFSFGFSEKHADGTLFGQGASTGFSSENGTCSMGSVYDQVLAGPPRGAITLEKRTTIAADFSKDAQGFCTTTAARQAAAGRPCSSVEHLAAEFVEAL